jgi:hypothetical protein
VGARVRSLLTPDARSDVRQSGVDLLKAQIRSLGGLTMGTTMIVRRVAEGKDEYQVWDGSHRHTAVTQILEEDRAEDSELVKTLRTVKVVVMK